MLLASGHRLTPRDQRTVAWIRRRTDSAAGRGELPRFGTNDWHQLGDDDPRKLAAVLLAALAHWHDQHPAVIAARLHDELAVYGQLEQREWERIAARVRRMAQQPTWAEIRRRWAS